MSSLEYVELAGLRTALANLEARPRAENQMIMDWMRNRISELNSRAR